MQRSPAEIVRELAKRQLDLERRVEALEAGGGWGSMTMELEDDFAPVNTRSNGGAEGAQSDQDGWARREVEPGIFEYRSPVNEKHREFREKLAHALAWVDWHRPTSDDGPPPIDAETGIPAFIEGGALWLYDYDRDFIFWHGPDVFHALVADVLACGAQQQAQELSADLLKDRDQGPMGMSDTFDIVDTFTKGSMAGNSGGWAGGKRLQ